MNALRSMPIPPTIRTLIAGAALLSLIGCGGQTDEISKQLTSLEKEVGRLRSVNLSLQDRVDMLEERGAGAVQDVAVEEAGAGDDRPVLEVVRLTPRESLAEPAPVVMTPEGDANAPRPVITGDARGVERVDDEGAKMKAGKKAAWRKKR